MLDYKGFKKTKVANTFREIVCHDVSKRVVTFSIESFDYIVCIQIV